MLRLSFALLLLLLFLWLPIFVTNGLVIDEKSSIISLFARHCESIALFNQMIEAYFTQINLISNYLHTMNACGCVLFQWASSSYTIFNIQQSHFSLLEIQFFLYVFHKLIAQLTRPRREENPSHNKRGDNVQNTNEFGGLWITNHAKKNHTNPCQTTI